MNIKELSIHINNLRVVPRFILMSYGFLVWKVTIWAMALPDPSLAQTGILTTIIGIAGVVVSSYQNTGNIR